MSIHWRNKGFFAIFGIIGVALLVMAPFANRSDDKAREIEMEWRIPIGSPEQVPNEIGMVSIDYSDEAGPVTDQKTKRGDQFVVLSDSALISPGVREISPYVLFRATSPRLAAWSVKIPRQGLMEHWSEWQRATFTDDSEEASFKLLNGNRDSRQEKPKDLAIEMRFRVPSYFSID